MSELKSPSGATLALYTAKPSKRPKAVIQVLHGMSEHAGRYSRFADALTDAGYALAAHDHRGHGDTKAPDAPRGVFAADNGEEAVLADTLAVNRHIREINHDLPVILFGHSMGSIIGLNHCIRHSDTIAGAALWNLGADAGVLLTIMRILLKLERMFKGSDVPSRIATRATFTDWNKKFAPNRTDFDWLSRDEAEVDQYVSDDLCGFACSVGLWLSVTDLIRVGADDRALAKIRHDLPMHLLGGEADPCSDFGRAMISLAYRLNHAGVRDVTLKTLPHTRHESLNEINRKETTAGFISWLDERF